MGTAICTLFEKDYHHGVAALVNSLVRWGFSGTIYAGYRGALPAWAQGGRQEARAGCPDAQIVDANDTCQLALLPLVTDAHFTNIKPDFMLQVLQDQHSQIDQLFYLDPDIVLATKWEYMQDWISCGVALCEDVNSPIGEHHPRRIGWRRYFSDYGIPLQFRTPSYVNGGCVGIRKQDIAFLENWRQLSQLMANAIGGLGVSKLEGSTPIDKKGFANCFDCSDQDVLNATMEMTSGLAYSILPRAAMAFEAGSIVVPHALGARKPWRRRYVREALSAVPPTLADKAFWENASGPLQSFSAATTRTRRGSLTIASAIGRAYRRGP